MTSNVAMSEQLKYLAGEGIFQITFKTEDVILPEHLQQDEYCTLNFSHRFDPDDLVIGDNFVEQTLSFKGNWFLCRIPLANIVRVSGNQSKPTLTLAH